MKDTKILFMGTPDFAEASLKKLYDCGYNVCGVFTQPDRPKNRGMKMEFSPVKKLALQYDTEVFQPEKMRDGTALKIVEELSPDIIVAVAYGRILPEEIINYPRLGCINIHGSLLPKYRGSAPIQWSVLKGEKITGVTAMYMDVGMDTGDIIAVKETEIGENETAGELFDRLMVLGADLLDETLKSVIDGTATRTKQDEALATYAPPLKKEMCAVDWNMPAEEVMWHIRGLNPWPVATSLINGINFKIYSGEIISDTAANPGDIIFADKRGLAIMAADKGVLINELQAPGGKRMRSADYLRGHPIC